MHINELRKLSDEQVIEFLEGISERFGDSLEYANANDMAYDVLYERHGDEKATNIINAAFE